MSDLDPLLRCADLRRSYGARTAVDGVSFSIGRGETYGLLGPNGAGKTTTISMVCGLLARDAGTITIEGRPMDVGATAVKARIGYVPQDLAIYPDLSARENLRFFGRLQGMGGKELDGRVAEVLELIGLADRAKDRAGEFSGGMKRRLNIGIGLLHRPALLVLDEPTVGVDPQSRNAILESVAALGAEGMSILYTTHYMEEAERLCHRVGIIDEGRLRAEGTRAELVALVGGQDRVVLAVTGAAAAAAAALQALDRVADATVADGTIELVVDGARSLLPALLETTAAAGASVRSVEVAEPDLEAVFLHLTGKALPGLTAVHAALTIAAKDLRQKVRDRSAILLSVVAPFVLAAMFALVLPAGEGSYHTTWGWADLDGGPVAAAFEDGPLAGLKAAGVVDIVVVPEMGAARAAVDSGEVGSAIVIPAGFSDAVTRGAAATVEVIGSPNSVLSAQLARSVVAGFASRVEAGQVAVAAVLATTGAIPDAEGIAAIVAAADAEPDPVTFQATATGDRQASTSTYFAASMAVLFVFFAAQFGVMGLLAEKRAGTLARMLASPIAPRTVLLGKVLVSITLAVVSMGIIVIGTTLLLGARWGDPIAVAALIVATALSASGIALLVVGFARNEDQAGGLIAIVAMTLAILGGAFFPISQAPEGFARLSLLTPQAWFLRGINDLAAGGGVGTVVVPVVILTAIGAVTGLLGLARARRVTAP